jgi:hypothetical protein
MSETDDAKIRAVTSAVAVWLRSEAKKEISELDPRSLIDCEKAVGWAEGKIIHDLSDEARKGLMMIICQHTPGLVHIAYGRKRVRFLECGCESYGHEDKK